jgi:hypothetical protein
MLSPDKPARDIPEVSFLMGTALERAEIAYCADRIISACLDMQTATERNALAGVKVAAEEIQKQAAQASLLAAHLAKLAARHLARNPLVKV